MCGWNFGSLATLKRGQCDMPLFTEGLRRAGDRADTRSTSRLSSGREKSTAERAARFVEGTRDVAIGGLAVGAGIALGSTGVGAAIGAVGVMTGVATATVGSVKMIGAFSDVPSEDISAVSELANPLGAAGAAAVGVAGGTPDQMMTGAQVGEFLAQRVSGLNPKDPLSLAKSIQAMAKEILESIDAAQANGGSGGSTGPGGYGGRTRTERSYLGVGDLRDHFGGRAGDRSDRDYGGKGSLLGGRDLRADFGHDTGGDHDSGGDYDLGADTDFGDIGDFGNDD